MQARSSARVALDLLLELVEQRERVARRAREAREHLAVAEQADLARLALDHHVAHRDLAVGAERGAAALDAAEHGGRTESKFRHHALGCAFS
jgi:hypothetical protein